jgi:hypothetical protein
MHIYSHICIVHKSIARVLFLLYFYVFTRAIIRAKEFHDGDGLVVAWLKF